MRRALDEALGNPTKVDTGVKFCVEFEFLGPRSQGDLTFVLITKNMHFLALKSTENQALVQG